jgi:hypothetical protein
MNYTYHSDGIWLIRDSDSALVSQENTDFIKWRDGWIEEIRSPFVWSDYVPEVPATFDSEGVELTAFIPEVLPTVISGGDVIETIVHEPHTPAPYVAPPTPVPTSITMRQARLALLNAGLLDTVNAAVAAGSQQAQIEWEFSNEVQRSNPLIAQLTTALGWTTAQVYDLFIAGSQL